MAKEVITTSAEGFLMDNDVRQFSTTIDATGETAPDTLESLLAAYGSCFVPALRVGAEQRGVDDLGEVEIRVTGGLNEDDKLESIAFDAKVEADLEGKADEIVERAEALCKVHDALKESLHASVDVEGNAL